jgi:signal transduction histidine kinase
VRRGRLQRTDGTVLDYTAVPLPDGGTLLTYLDVTDRLQIERALIERNEALEAADRLKSEFVAHVSYELRTPINSILGFSEILEAEHFGALNDKQKEYVADIARSSKGLRSLINDILDLSMIEAGAMTIQTETVNIRDMLEEVVSIAAGDLEDKGLACTVSCPKNVGTLEGDRMRLVQIIYNLVTNAVKYTPSGGRITVGGRRIKDMVQIYVEDTGIGISEDEQEQVFTKFHTGSHDVLKGAGLGLSLVRRFVEMHNGEVVLQSELGKGTRVTCSLPRKQTAPEDPRRQWTETAQSEQAPASTLH